jgi:hypothetical protein
VLNDLAKRDPEHVSLEIDDDGALFYAFSRTGDRRDTFGKRYRVKRQGECACSIPWSPIQSTVQRLKSRLCQQS